MFHSDSAKLIGSAGWQVETSDAIHQSGFSGTGLPDDGNKFSLLNAEGNVMKRMNLVFGAFVVTFKYMLQQNQRRLNRHVFRPFRVILLFRITGFFGKTQFFSDFKK